MTLNLIPQNKILHARLKRYLTNSYSGRKAKHLHKSTSVIGYLILCTQFKLGNRSNIERSSTQYSMTGGGRGEERMVRVGGGAYIYCYFSTCSLHELVSLVLPSARIRVYSHFLASVRIYNFTLSTHR